MKKVHFIFILIVSILRRGISGNTGLIGPIKSPYERIDDDRFEEKSVKWNIDPDDMLNFEEKANAKNDFNKKEPTPVENYGTNAQVGVAEENNGHEKPAEENNGHEKPAEENNGHEKPAEENNGHEKPAEDINEFYGNEQANGGMKGTIENEIPPSVEPEMIQNKFNYFHQQVQDYITRYVYLFMRLLKIKNNPEDLDKFSGGVSVNFDFDINESDLRTLCQLTKELNVDNLIDNLRQIDSIFSRSLQPRPKYSLYEELRDFMDGSGFGNYWWHDSNFYFYIPLTLAALMIVLKDTAGFTYQFIFLLLMNNLILLEGILIYHSKLKEAKIIDEVERMKYKTIPASCYRDRQSFLAKMQDWFFGDDCLQYHKTMQMNRAESISLLENVMSAYLFYLIEVPSKVLGSAIKKFSVALNEFLPPPFNMLGTYISQIIVLLSLVTLLIVCFGLRITFFGRTIELDFSHWIRRRRRHLLDGGPPEYIRVQDLPPSLIREIELHYIHQPPDYVEQGLDSVSKIVKDTGKVEHRQVEESHVEENNANEIVDEDVVHDNVQFDSKDRTLSQEIKTVVKVPAELKTSE